LKRVVPVLELEQLALWKARVHLQLVVVAVAVAVSPLLKRDPAGLKEFAFRYAYFAGTSSHPFA
jgi:hypothetical protein